VVIDWPDYDDGLIGIGHLDHSPCRGVPGIGWPHTISHMTDLELRSLIYQQIVDTGGVPPRSDLRSAIAEPGALDEQLRDLHEAHMIVLDDRPDRVGEIRMALPFSAEPTNFRVETQRGAWFANCAWDSLAVAAALHEDAHITSTWNDTDNLLERDIVDGRLDDHDGLIEFQIPARQWWDDIVET
jgi:hypothetical protein